MVGVSSHSQVQDASRRCLFGKPRWSNRPCC